MANLFKTSNPALQEKAFETTVTQVGEEAMTVSGTMNKFVFMLALMLASAVFTWNLAYKGAPLGGWVAGGAIGGFITALIIIFKQSWAPYLAPAYGLLEGLFLGAISAMFNAAMASVAPYFVMQAVLLTFGVALAMYLLYTTGVIKVTNQFRTIVLAATGGIALFYLAAMVLHWFHIDIPFIHQSTTAGIVFSLIVVGIAALNLVMDFDMIFTGARMGAPKYMEWYGAFGLMVTIIWLYLEILRLLAKVYSRR
ncbi:MAG: Bax inhibitor-1/YccA family protein [Thermoflavifilum aggregans]|nr:Bax inhibitor-1/YccA family protein [Thermoflavifilum aggregans]